MTQLQSIAFKSAVFCLKYGLNKSYYKLDITARQLPRKERRQIWRHAKKIILGR